MSTASKVVYSGQDVEVTVRASSNAGSVRWLVTFNAWSADQEGAYFAQSFIEKHGISAIMIRSKRNHWWHTPELGEVIRCINEHAPNGQAVHYGASMGAYGAFYVSAMTGGMAMCFSPQIAVTTNSGLNDPRWRKEWDQIVPAFDELTVARAPRQSPAFVFLDTSDPWDSKHAAVLAEVARDENVHVIDVPYSGHTSIRLLHASGLLKKTLLDLVHGRELDPSELRKEASQAYSSTPKSFANYARKNIPRLSKEDVERLWSDFAQREGEDFEYLFMVAEAAAALNNPKVALEASWASLEAGPLVDYQLTKHAAILKSTVGVLAASTFLARYADSKAFTPMVARMLQGLTASLAGREDLKGP